MVGWGSIYIISYSWIPDSPTCCCWINNKYLKEHTNVICLLNQSNEWTSKSFWSDENLYWFELYQWNPLKPQVAGISSWIVCKFVDVDLQPRIIRTNMHFNDDSNGNWLPKWSWAKVKHTLNSVVMLLVIYENIACKRAYERGEKQKLFNLLYC